MSKARRIGVALGLMLFAFLAVVLALSATLVLHWRQALDDLFANRRINRTGDWPSFYRSDVKDLFTVPTAATIVRAEEYQDAIMGGGFRVEFRLPPSRTPEKWLKEILSGPASSLKEYKKGPYRYDGSRKLTDEYWLEYFPEKRLYAACWRWD